MTTATNTASARSEVVPGETTQAPRQHDKMPLGAPAGRKTINVRILRQADAAGKQYWDTFAIPYRPNMNIISVLMDIRETPVNSAGKRVDPVAWECACLEEVCGSCSMNINGIPRQACSALVDRLPDPIVLEPFKKFPVVRDLVVDRQSMFDNLKRVKAWVPIDGTYDLGSGPRMAEEQRAFLYKFQQCMTCGCCVEACPQVNDHSEFIGATTIGWAYLYNNHPTGKMHASTRLDALMGPGGIQVCGKAQNCVRVCPKGIPLTDAIFASGRAVTLHAIKKFFTG